MTTPPLTPAHRITQFLNDFNEVWNRPVRRLDAWKTILVCVQTVLREVVARVGEQHANLLVVELADREGLPPSVVVNFARKKHSGHPPVDPNDARMRAGWREAGATLSFNQDFATGLVLVQRTPFRGMTPGNLEFDLVMSLVPEEVEEAAPLLLVDFVQWAIATLPGAARPSDLKSWRLQHNLASRLLSS